MLVNYSTFVVNYIWHLPWNVLISKVQLGSKTKWKQRFADDGMFFEWSSKCWTVLLDSPSPRDGCFMSIVTLPQCTGSLHCPAQLTVYLFDCGKILEMVVREPFPGLGTAVASGPASPSSPTGWRGAVGRIQLCGPKDSSLKRASSPPESMTCHCSVTPPNIKTKNWKDGETNGSPLAFLSHHYSDLAESAAPLKSAQISGQAQGPRGRWRSPCSVEHLGTSKHHGFTLASSSRSGLKRGQDIECKIFRVCDFILSCLCVLVEGFALWHGEWGFCF